AVSNRASSPVAPATSMRIRKIFPLITGFSIWEDDRQVMSSDMGLRPMSIEPGSRVSPAGFGAGARVAERSVIRMCVPIRELGTRYLDRCAGKLAGPGAGRTRDRAAGHGPHQRCTHRVAGHLAP